MSNNKIIPDKPVKKIRNEDLNIGKLRGKIKYVLNQDKTQLTKPSREGLFTDHIFVNPNNKDKDKSIFIKGNKYHPIIGKICNLVNAGISPQIYIVGQQRLGKTKLGHYILSVLHDEINLLRGSYDPENQLIYNNIEYLTATAQFKRIGMVCDEAENYLNTQDRWSDFVKNVSGLIRSQSIRENPQLIITPTFKHIAPQIRKHADIIIHLIDKRVATVKTIQARHDKIDSKGYDYKFKKYPTWLIPKLPSKKVKEFDKIENQYKGKYAYQLLLDGINKELENKKEDNISTL